MVWPIFSSGVYLATQSAELSSAEIVKAFRENRFEARRFRGYQKAIRRGMQPFQRFIRNFYDPSFTEVFLNPREFAAALPLLILMVWMGTPVSLDN